MAKFDCSWAMENLLALSKMGRNLRGQGEDSALRAATPSPGAAEPAEAAAEPDAHDAAAEPEAPDAAPHDAAPQDAAQEPQAHAAEPEAHDAAAHDAAAHDAPHDAAEPDAPLDPEQMTDLDRLVDTDTPFEFLDTLSRVSPFFRRAMA